MTTKHKTARVTQPDPSRIFSSAVLILSAAVAVSNVNVYSFLYHFFLLSFIYFFLSYSLTCSWFYEGAKRGAYRI
jgi:hypothetical protein